MAMKMMISFKTVILHSMAHRKSLKDQRGVQEARSQHCEWEKSSIYKISIWELVYVDEE